MISWSKSPLPWKFIKFHINNAIRQKILSSRGSIQSNQALLMAFIVLNTL